MKGNIKMDGLGIVAALLLLFVAVTKEPEQR